MGGSAVLISTVLGTVAGMTRRKPNSSGDMEQERKAREEQQRKKEADARRRDREKVQEARNLEKKRNAKTLSKNAASLVEEDAPNPMGLKNKLGE
ncbi:hypothetical protein [uncultured Pseudodesulfovibrio sp.]|uniref:hypothetical protein n=1 Tax=uncultured Pseudodesulfovibrio sp. TaxID=2035858 RepID=UPI003749177C